MDLKTKKIVVIFGVFLTIVFVLGLVTFSYYQSKMYWELAQSSKNENQRIEYLIKSNFFGADNTKKLKLAALLIKKGDHQGAEKYIKSLNGVEGRFYKAGFQIETNSSGTIGIKGELGKELNDLQRFLNGAAIKGEGQSDYAAVIRYFNNEDKLIVKESYSLLYSLVVKAEAMDLSPIEKGLFLARSLNELNQPTLSLKVLKDLGEQHGIFKELYILKIDSYIKANNSSGALKVVTEALSLYPADEIFLTRAIELAKGQGHQDAVEVYQKRLQLLESLDRR